MDLDGETDAAFAFLTWVLERTVPTSRDELCVSLARNLDVRTDTAAELVSELVEAGVLIESQEAHNTAQALRTWAAHGWDEAALFHHATFGQPFDPDTLNDVSYEEYYQYIVQNPSVAGSQPPASPPTPSHTRAVARDDSNTPPAVSFDNVLNRSAPVNHFTRNDIMSSELLDVLTESFGTQRVVNSLLGEHLIKAYPSGGARHPLEIYVIAKSVAGLEMGLYHFDARGGTLQQLGGTDATSRVDGACFDKDGIVTASAVLIVTCRWPRHNWKYRYSRSYRMVLLELGHAIQAINLSARAKGADIYQCPSINDEEMLSLLRLTDDCIEGPLYAIGIGKAGARE